MQMELLKSNKVEIRAVEENDNSLTVSGYVNKTDQPSEILGDKQKFIEKIAPGAFTKALQRAKNPIDFLAEHDRKYLLASTNNGSLTLKEDKEGLYFEARISPTSWGKDYYQLIKDGLIQNMSFGFRAVKDKWKRISQDLLERTVYDLELYEVSAVKNPAYTQSNISARNIDIIEDIEIPSELMEIKKVQRSFTNMEKIQNEVPELNKILRGEARSLQTTADGATVIPENVANVIVEKIEDISPIFAMAQKFPTVAGSLKVACEGNDDVVAAFVGEGVDLVEQQLKLEYSELKQKRVGAALTLTNQLINDSAVNMDEYVPQLLARRVAKAIEKSMLVGVGGDEFNGIVNDPEIGRVDVTGSITYDTLQDLYLSIHPQYLANACFVMQRDMFKNVAKLKSTDGNFILQNGIVNGKINYTLFDIPVYPTENLPADTPIVFGDITEAVAVLIKQEQGLRQIVDSGLALKGAKMYLFDAYMDSAVVNPQAVAKLTISAA